MKYLNMVRNNNFLLILKTKLMIVRKGMAYVAFSRVKSLSDIQLKGFDKS